MVEKMLEFRLVQDSFHDAFTNMAIDEAIMQNCTAFGKPTIRFYGWKPAAISIGYFQSLMDEIDLKKCNELKVDFVRRITGGGAVFHETELTYSFVCSEESNLVSKNILESYNQICNGLILGFKELGLIAKFVPLNDIIINGKKISGNAQTRRQKTILQHGTILLKVDVEKMFSLLKVSNEKIRDKLISDVKQRVTSIENELGKEVSLQNCAIAMKKGFEKAFNAKLVEEKLTAEELKLAEKIKKEQFSKKEWNFKR